MRRETPSAKSRIAKPIIAYHKVCRAWVTLSLLPPEVIKRNADQRTIMVAMTVPIPRSQLAMVPMSVGISLPPVPNGLGISITAALTLLTSIPKKRKKSKKVFIVAIITVIYLTVNNTG